MKRTAAQRGWWASARGMNCAAFVVVCRLRASELYDQVRVLLRIERKAKRPAVMARLTGRVAGEYFALAERAQDAIDEERASARR